MSKASKTRWRQRRRAMSAADRRRAYILYKSMQMTAVSMREIRESIGRAVRGSDVASDMDRVISEIDRKNTVDMDNQPDD